MANGAILIYGATGYTGRLIAERAVAIGLRPILAGRDRARVGRIATTLGLDHRAFPLDDARALHHGLEGVAVVVHAAGPFSATARPMAGACLSVSAHYLDITGEIAVFEALAGLDDAARAAGVMLLPGAGFDVVPSDCLAAHVVGRLPAATRLHLSIGGLNRVSRGTAKTMIEGLGRGTAVRAGGRIVERAAVPRGGADFGDGPRPTVGVSWGDVATAWHSTGVPDIAVFFEASGAMRAATALPGAAKRLLGSAAVQRFLKGQVDRRLPAGPSAEHRATGSAAIVAEAWDAQGRRCAARLITPEPYAFTAVTAVELARRAVAGEAGAGFQTPAKAYGAELVLSFPSVTRTDL